MSDWKFILIDRNGNRTNVDVPINWTDPQVAISRDKQTGWHGVFFDYGVDDLQFQGDGAKLIQAEYETYGVNGEMHLDIYYRCGDGQRFDVFYENGRISFDRYEDTCGNECTVTVGIEDSSDIMQFKNNYEQNIDLNSLTAFDQTTSLPNYDKLNFDIQLPARGLVYRSEAISSAAVDLDFFSVFQSDWEHMNNPGNATEEGSFNVLMATADDVKINEVGDGGSSFETQPFFYPNDDPGDMFETVDLPGNISSAIKCVPGKVKFQVSAAGTVQYTAFGDHTFALRISIKRGPDKDHTNLVAEQFGVNGFFTNSKNHPFSIDINTEAVLDPGDKVWIYYYITFAKSNVAPTASLSSLNFHQNPAARIYIEETLTCEPSPAKVSMINESLSRAVESVTNGKIRAYSDFFGRKDSQPYPTNYDSCAGLMAITNGLNVRRKLLKTGQQPGFFVTMKQLFEGLNPIWNIGLTIEPDPNRQGFKRLRIEHWRFFYQDDVAIRFPNATNITRKCDLDRLYNRMTVGYNKWEASATTGLDELMTKRTYRININSISKELDVTTDVICSPYTIEITRKQDTNTDDWQYDNDVFGFCLLKDNSGYRVETFSDNVTEANNVIDPITCYNARVTPARNAMRWFDTVMQGLRTLQPDSKLIFSSGVGNYVAQLQTNKCNIEGKLLAENEDIDVTDFESVDAAKPIMYPDLVTFDHPMNYNTFKRLKDDATIRYKSFSYSCNGNTYEGWLDELVYKPDLGMCTITLIPKNKTKVSLPPEPICDAAVGAVTITPNGDGKVTISWVQSVPGAAFWQVIVTKSSQPFTTLNSSTTSVSLSGLPAGNFNVLVIPFCDTDFPGANYGEGAFTISAPTFAIQLSAILTTGRRSNNKMQLTANGNIPSPYGVSFKFGQCAFNTSTGLEACRAYPGAPVAPPSAPSGIISFNAGDISDVAESMYPTPGADFGYVTKVVLYDLVGITPAQITKAAGQTWTLVFL